MSPKRLEWKVGLFVLVCLVLLGVLVLNFSKGLTFFTPTYTLHLKTANVGGIKREASVLMAGVQVGNVTGAELSPEGTNVTVFLKILNRYRIHRLPCFAQIYNSSTADSLDGRSLHRRVLARLRLLPG